MTNIKTISLHQPWATVLAAGYKRIETRDWRPASLRPGQLIAIHAAKQWPPDEWDEMQEDPWFARHLELARRRHLWSFTHPPLGGVVAIARFQGAYPTEQIACASWRGKRPPEREATVRLYVSDRERAFGNYQPGRYGWLFSEVRPVAIIPARGQQGLFDWDAPREIAALYQEPLNRMRASDLPLMPPETPAVAPLALGETRVVHVRRGEFDPANPNCVYVGRQMPKYPELKATGWGNPYKDGLDTPAGRQSAIDRYRAWLLDQPKLLARLPELRGKRLGCWCAPAGGLPGDLHGRVCHGEVLAALADGWCDQCHALTDAEHVREHAAAAETAMGQVIARLTGSRDFSEERHA